jgi:hypothetical protein
MDLGKWRTEHVKPSYQTGEKLFRSASEPFHTILLIAGVLAGNVPHRHEYSGSTRNWNIYSISSGWGHCAILRENRAAGHFFRAKYWLLWLSFTPTERPLSILRQRYCSYITGCHFMPQTASLSDCIQMGQRKVKSTCSLGFVLLRLKPRLRRTF